MSAIALVVEIEPKPGLREKFLARARTHRDLVLKNEPGCKRFDLLTAQEAADTVFLYEIYTDAAALETHFNTAYMKDYLADSGPMIAKRRRSHCDLAND